MESLMPKDEGLLRVCCLAPPEQLVQYAVLEPLSWRVTTRARVVTAAYGSKKALREAKRADLVYLDCSTAGLAGALAIKDQILKGRRTLVRYSVHRQDWMARERQISAADLSSALVKWLSEQVKERKLVQPNIVWVRGELELDLLRQSIDGCIGPVLDLYFRGRPGPAYIHAVGGGLSGTPLVRLEFGGSDEQYYLKFFEREDEFKTEFAGHESALQWLGDLTVKLKPVPNAKKGARGQWEALRRLDWLPAPLAPSRPFYPVCYESTRASKTLKELYQDAPAVSLLPQDAYRAVIKLLRTNNPRLTKPPEMLFECRDYGPPARPADDRRTILDTLLRSEYRVFIERACQDLGRFEAALKREVNWSSGLHLLQGLLTGTLPSGMRQQYSLVHGHIHGDANSRNFLFTTDPTGAPSGVQVIDCGCHASGAPLLFDPAQLESDLKINLMTSETASSYEEIDVAQLPLWIRMERRAIKEPFTFKIPQRSPASVKRAYAAVQVIRGYVQRTPSKDAKGQPSPNPYFYFLLYWTLRKLRHPAVPPTKRLFAMASVFLLLKELNK
jgi:hypothetical protein